MSDTDGQKTLQTRTINAVFSYGALGIFAAVVIWQVIVWLNTFRPVLLQRFADDAKVQREMSLTYQQMAGALIDLRTEMKKGNETLLGAVSTTCARKK